MLARGVAGVPGERAELLGGAPGVLVPRTDPAGRHVGRGNVLPPGDRHNPDGPVVGVTGAAPPGVLVPVCASAALLG